MNICHTDSHKTTAARLCLILMAALSFLAGCEPVNYVLFAFEDDRIPARYELAKDTSVVVLVDDPNHLLGDLSLPRLVSAYVSDGLSKNLKKINVVKIEKVIDLERKTGEDFASMPVDQIGSEVGATQAIYVLIESAGISGDPGLYRPQAVVRVNVIDVATGNRLFPASDFTNAQGDTMVSTSRGEPVEIKLPYTTSDQNPIGETAVLMRKLSEQIGINVAKLFYRHHPDPVPGYMD